MDEELKQISRDYRTRINHLIRAVDKIGNAVFTLTEGIPETERTRLRRMLRDADEALTEAGWEL